MTPQIAKRAYELYEERDRKDGRSVQDWEKAEGEVRKGESKAGSKPEAKAEPKPEAKVEPKPEAKAKPKPEPKVRIQGRGETRSKAKVEPEPKPEPSTDLNLHIVKRVHDLYEELGREDVREVEECEKAARNS